MNPVAKLKLRGFHCKMQTTSEGSLGGGMKKSDVLAALVIGEVCSWLILAVFKNLRVELPLVWSLLIVLPVLSLAGLWVAFFLGKKIPVLWQVAKFGLVGILNTLMDLGILNFLIFISGIASGWLYVAFKGTSFSLAVINSYFWNKFWTFREKGTASGKEFIQFLVISVMGFGINVGLASLVVNVVGPQFGLTEKLWANVGALAAVSLSMIWNFAGYKFIVFKSSSSVAAA